MQVFLLRSTNSTSRGELPISLSEGTNPLRNGETTLQPVCCTFTHLHSSRNPLCASLPTRDLPKPSLRRVVLCCRQRAAEGQAPKGAASRRRQPQGGRGGGHRLGVVHGDRNPLASSEGGLRGCVKACGERRPIRSAREVKVPPKFVSDSSTGCATQHRQHSPCAFPFLHVLLLMPPTYVGLMCSQPPNFANSSCLCSSAPLDQFTYSCFLVSTPFRQKPHSKKVTNASPDT